MVSRFDLYYYWLMDLLSVVLSLLRSCRFLFQVFSFLQRAAQMKQRQQPPMILPDMMPPRGLP